VSWGSQADMAVTWFLGITFFPAFDTHDDVLCMQLGSGEWSRGDYDKQGRFASQPNRCWTSACWPEHDQYAVGLKDQLVDGTVQLWDNGSFMRGWSGQLAGVLLVKMHHFDVLAQADICQTTRHYETHTRWKNT
jgi:hypothetical protein